MKDKGFTLIELIVVIVILGILSVVAAPKFIDLKHDANVAVLNGVRGAIHDANNLVHSYAVIHNIDKLNLASGMVHYSDAMVRFDGGKIVKVDKADEGKYRSTLFFLNMGYIATTYGDSRNSGLALAIGKDAGKTKGLDVYNISSATTSAADSAYCDPIYGSMLCYTSPQQPQWQYAYIIMSGYKASECALRYNSAKLNRDGTVTPPEYILISSGC